ncbi:fibronectin type III domain-containing protein [Candidatus Dojkabacteria bacterium]|jgi:hypothetical protein|nr:fibronectin type III domain-containing protein [Candidatus Dojkabacteria bacterium]
MRRRTAVIKNIVLCLVAFFCIFPNINWFSGQKEQEKVHAADFSMRTGFYIGDGRTLSITGLGFAPDMVIIKSDTSNTATVFKTTAMPSANMAYFSATPDNRDSRLILGTDGFTVSESDEFRLDTDGFTLRSSANLNIANTRYTWVAFDGSDCVSSSSTFCIGTYTGSSASTQDITIGFQPDFVMVKRDTAVAANYKTTALGSNNNSLFFINLVKNTTGVYISSLNATGFTVGSTDNARGGTFYYAAFKESANFFKQGSYSGNSTDNTIISDVGFQPDFVVVKNGTNATANNTHGFANQIESYGNSSSYFAATANLVNMIKGIESAGFKLGTDVKVNATGDTYYYLAFGGVPAATGSGTYRMAQGYYTGNGEIQSIEDIGFAPDLVIIKNNANRIAVFRTRMMALDSTAYFTGATANTYGAILSLNEDSFDVGANTSTNTSGNTYHWQAFGNAYDSEDNSGASNFAIGAIYGNGLDDRNITNLPFAPDMVVVKSITNAGAAVMRTSSQTGDLTAYFQATADAANFVQGISADGFQVGSGVTVNTSAVVYFWFAFKSSDDFRVGTYIGNTPSTQSIEIDSEGFQFNLVWTVPSNAVGGMMKPSTLSGTSSQYFLATANATTQITGITATGFSVGTGTSANGAVSMWYVAWKVPDFTPPTNLPGAPGAPSFSNTSVTSTVISWTSASNADHYLVDRATDRSGSAGLYRYVGTTAGLSMIDSNINANQTYWYRVRASNSNGYGPYGSENSVTTTAQSLEVRTGYYIGTGNQFSISGLGFAPEMIIVKSDTSNIPMMFKTSTMRDDVIGFFSANAYGSITSMNVENVRYTWIAFSGSDCTSSGYFCLGVFSGTGAVKNLTTGFQPDFVTVKNNDAVAANYKTTALGSNNNSLFFVNTVKNTSGVYISSLNADGFSVGTTNSVAGGTFHYFAFKENANFFKQGSYSGNSTDETVISDVGFQPDFVVVKNGTNATANNTYAFANQTESYGNSSSYFAATANLVNMIKGIESTGFKLGTDVKVNATGDTYYYLAFGGVPTVTGSGTYRMAQGSYTGDGGIQDIEGVGFAPDLVIIKNNSAQIAVFRTRMMGGNSTAYFTGATANLADAISQLTENGFVIGGDSRVNASGNTYHWQAFGNAYNPMDNSGASDFAIGAIYGNGLDDRNITDLPFTPDMVVVKSITNAGAAVIRTSSQTGDLTAYFQANADVGNFVQSLGSNGFQIGSGVTVNTSTVVYFWFAFKVGDNFRVGTYTGNTPSTQSIEIDSGGFQSNLVWTVPSNAVGGMMKPSTLSGTSSQYFLATANATTQITGITATGFSVGTGTSANGAVSMWYVAWKVPIYLISISISDGAVAYGILDFSGSKTTLSSDMPPTGDMQTVTNDSSSAVNINIKGQNSVGDCIWTLSGTNGFNEYKHQFCNATDDDCTTPPANYSDLATSYQSLATNVVEDASINFHLRLVMPTDSSCYDLETVNVTVQASEI